MRHTLLILATLALFVPATASAQIERRLERTFTVTAGALVTVEMAGAPISVSTGSGNSVTMTLRQIVDARNEAEADELLADYEIVAAQQAGDVRLVARRNRDRRDMFGRSRVRFEATLTVPAHTRLDLNTSGGAITVRGHRTASVDADTSGGSISVDGGTGDLRLDTSGGTIRVGRALGLLDADTSGGSIAVDYVGPAATNVRLDTSGGSINVGVDPAAKLHVRASTSGGGVNVSGLSLEATSIRRSNVSGILNGGGGQLSVSTSGGSINIRPASGQ